MPGTQAAASPDPLRGTAHTPGDPSPQVCRAALPSPAQSTAKGSGVPGSHCQPPNPRELAVDTDRAGDTGHTQCGEFLGNRQGPPRSHLKAQGQRQHSTW